MKTINWGILGAARVNQRLLPAIENNPHSKLIMLASRRDGAAEECINQYSNIQVKSKQVKILMRSFSIPT